MYVATLAIRLDTGALGQKFDLRELVNVKGRDMNKQVTQLKYAAETEAFRRKLEVSGAKERSIHIPDGRKTRSNG